MNLERTVGLLTVLLEEARDELRSRERTIDYYRDKERKPNEIYSCPHCGNCEEDSPGREPQCSAECHPAARMVPIRSELVRLRDLLRSRGVNAFAPLQIETKP